MFPALSERMENMIVMMANVLIVETFAEDTFAWAQQLLGDPEVSADPQRAAHVIECIARDEVPHVDYLTVALSELRSRTLIGSRRQAGICRQRRDRQRVPSATARHGDAAAAAIARSSCATKSAMAIADAQRASVIAKRFEDLDSGWTFPHPDDEALDVLLTAA